MEILELTLRNGEGTYIDTGSEARNHVFPVQLICKFVSPSTEDDMTDDLDLCLQVRVKGYRRVIERSGR